VMSDGTEHKAEIDVLEDDRPIDLGVVIELLEAEIDNGGDTGIWGDYGAACFARTPTRSRTGPASMQRMGDERRSSSVVRDQRTRPSGSVGTRRDGR